MPGPRLLIAIEALHSLVVANPALSECLRPIWVMLAVELCESSQKETQNLLDGQDIPNECVKLKLRSRLMAEETEQLSEVNKQQELELDGIKLDIEKAVSHLNQSRSSQSGVLVMQQASTAVIVQESDSCAMGPAEPENPYRAAYYSNLSIVRELEKDQKKSATRIAELEKEVEDSKKSAARIRELEKEVQDNKRPSARIMDLEEEAEIFTF